MGIQFYCGINEDRWNHHPCAPGPYACISPVYGKTERTKMENRVRIPQDVIVIQDSGAFSDGPNQRLSFAEALVRQERHAIKYSYADQIVYRASYDLLIDEKWNDGRRFKQRWSEDEAEQAVQETVDAAKFLSSHRNGAGLVLSAQGVTPAQYIRCAEQVLPVLDPDTDILGLGGWCIIGKLSKQMLPVFRETIVHLIPYITCWNVKRVHIWGVVYAPALGELLWLCDQHGIDLSTDSAGPSYRPAFGEWGYADWRQPYQRPPVETRGLERARHVAATRTWLASLQATRFYREPKVVQVYQSAFLF